MNSIYLDQKISQVISQVIASCGRPSASPIETSLLGCFVKPRDGSRSEKIDEAGNKRDVWAYWPYDDGLPVEIVGVSLDNSLQFTQIILLVKSGGRIETVNADSVQLLDSKTEKEIKNE